MFLRMLTNSILLIMFFVTSLDVMAETHVDAITGSGSTIQRPLSTHNSFVQKSAQEEIVSEWNLVTPTSKSPEDEAKQFVSLVKPNDLVSELVRTDAQFELNDTGINNLSLKLVLEESCKYLCEKVDALARKGTIEFTSKKLLSLYQELSLSKKKHPLRLESLDSLKQTHAMKVEVIKKGTDYAIRLVWPNCNDPSNHSNESCDRMDGTLFESYLVPWKN